MKKTCLKQPLQNFTVQRNGKERQKCTKNKAAVGWKFGHCYFLRDFFDALCSNYYYFGKNFFFNYDKTRGKQLFKASVFTTVASRLKSVQKEKEK